MSDRFRSALEDAWKKIEDRQWVYGQAGRLNQDGSYTFSVPGRPTFIYVTMRNAAGAQTVVPARNDAGVPHAPRLNIRMRQEKGVYVIYGKTGRNELGINPPSLPSGVEEHNHDDRYYRENEFLVVSAGASDAGKPVRLDVNGQIDASMINDADINLDNVTEGSTNKFFTDAEKTKLAGVEVGAYVRRDGTTPLTANWDIGDSYRILADGIMARDAAGLRLEDDGGNLGIFVEDGGQVGVGTDGPEATLHAAGTTPFVAERTTGATNTLMRATAFLLATTTGSAADGYGPSLDFYIRDDSSPDSVNIARFGAVRAGADNTGDFSFRPLAAGVENEVMRLRSTGRLHLGDLSAYRTSPDPGYLSIEHLETTVTKQNLITLIIDSSDDKGPELQLLKTRATTVGLGDLVQTGDELGTISFYGGDGPTNTPSVGAAIKAIVDAGTPANNLIPTKLSFLTKTNNINSLDERMQIDNYGRVFIQGGRSGGVEARVGGILYQSITTVGNVGGGTDNLMQYAIPAYTLAENGDSIWFETIFSLANNANNKTTTVAFGSTTLATIGGTGGNKQVIISGRIWRVTNTTQRAMATLFDTTLTASWGFYTAPTETLSNSITIKGTGNSAAGASDDIRQVTFTVGYDPANS